MRTMRSLLAIPLLLLLTLPATAHFIWLVPQDGASAILVFSDSLDPDENVPIKKVAQVQLQAQAPDGQALKWQKTEAADHYKIALVGKGPAELTATCRYGVMSKKGDPYLLMYYAQTQLGTAGTASQHAETKTEDRPLRFAPVAGKANAFRVLWHGKTAENVEVIAHLKAGNQTLKADASGTYTLALPAENKGPIGVRARFIEKTEGTSEGKAYKEVKHYATWTMTPTP